MIWIMRPLHIEMAFIRTIGGWLEGSCWVDNFKRSKINTVGRTESYLSGTNVKRNCCTYQVSLASLVYLSNYYLLLIQGSN